MRKILAVFLALVSMQAMGASNVLLWDEASTNELGFSIERKPVACAATGTFVEIATVTQNITTYTDSSVVEGVTYCYQVRAFGPGGLYSGYSNTAERLVPFTAPIAPSNLRVQGGT